MSSLEILIPKFDVVSVTRSTRGRFPGQKAPKGVTGLVWSTWTSNAGFNTKKLSILSAEGEITFTTQTCVEIVGSLPDYPHLKKSYNAHVEKHYVPVICTLEKSFDFDGSISMNNSVCVKYLGVNTKRWIKQHAICLEDLQYMYENQHDKVFSLNVEPWVLKKHSIL